MLGVLVVQSDWVAGLDEGDDDLLQSLANHIAFALTKARLYQRLVVVKHRFDAAPLMINIVFIYLNK
jgi:GAF domain-containing protein